MRLGEKVSRESLKEKIKERVAGKVDVQLGKNGVTEGFIEEVKPRLEKHGVVKIRVLKSYRSGREVSVEELAARIAAAAGGRVYETRGFTIILVKTGSSRRGILKD